MDVNYEEKINNFKQLTNCNDDDIAVNMLSITNWDEVEAANIYSSNVNNNNTTKVPENKPNNKKETAKDYKYKEEDFIDYNDDYIDHSSYNDYTSFNFNNNNLDNNNNSNKKKDLKKKELGVSSFSKDEADITNKEIMESILNLPVVPNYSSVNLLFIFFINLLFVFFINSF